VPEEENESSILMIHKFWAPLYKIWLPGWSDSHYLCAPAHDIMSCLICHIICTLYVVDLAQWKPSIEFGYIGEI